VGLKTFRFFALLAIKQKHNKKRNQRMKVTVPVKNEDGTLKFEATLSEKELHAVLEFGLNMMCVMGLMSTPKKGELVDLSRIKQEDMYQA
jgi:hypothetical protein